MQYLMQCCDGIHQVYSCTYTTAWNLDLSIQNLISTDSLSKATKENFSNPIWTQKTLNAKTKLFAWLHLNAISSASAKAYPTIILPQNI